MKTLSALALISAAAFFTTGCCKDCKTEACADGTACKDGAKCDGKDCKPSADASKAGTVNTMCVMNPSESIADGVNTDYKGMKLGFCCPGCVAKFNKLSDADKVAKLAKVGVTVK